jgi:hypothetical protein
VREYVIDGVCHSVLRRRFAYSQGMKMRLATLNLGSFLVPQVVPEKAALRFNDEVEALADFPLNEAPSRRCNYREAWAL